MNPTKGIPANRIVKGMLLCDPHKTGGYLKNGKLYYRYYNVIMVRKLNLLLDDYSIIPKFDEEGDPIEYEVYL